MIRKEDVHASIYVTGENIRLYNTAMTTKKEICWVYGKKIKVESYICLYTALFSS
jgi:hypothetical protein